MFNVITRSCTMTPMAKRDPPVARCTACGAVGTSLDALERGDHHCRGGGRGASSSAIAPGDWTECDQCKATGETNSMRCDACEGIGWHYTRKGP